MLKNAPEFSEEPDAVPVEIADRKAGPATLLLVDDEDSLRTLCRKILASFGYVVLEASAPERALKIVRAHEGPIDLLLTDIVMPEMEGPELATRVLELRPGTPVLFMSGYADAAERLGLANDRRFLQKPFTPDALARKIREALETPSAV
ncbi:MAG: response regulator [Acidobacteriota bacterium]